MRIAVIGAGAIGSAIAAALVEAGQDTVLVARGDRLATLRHAPLRLESNGELREVGVDACAVEDLGEGSIAMAICCVKTPGLEPALRSFGVALSPDAALLTLQNGVESHETAARLLPDAAIVAGRMHGFFEMTGDVVRHVGVAPSILLGSAQGNAAAEARVANAFAGSGIAARISNDITLALWKNSCWPRALAASARRWARPPAWSSQLPKAKHCCVMRWPRSSGWPTIAASDWMTVTSQGHWLSWAAFPAMPQPRSSAISQRSARRNTMRSRPPCRALPRKAALPSACFQNWNG